MHTPITVSTLNTQIKSLLETTFIQVYVEGEVSNLTYHNSGHIYFSVKDQSSTISCVMFRGNTKYLKFQLEVGQKVVISGNITVYAPRGNYQLLCNKIEPSGKGALALAFEQLKSKLELKGYFNPEIKKTIPKYPKLIALVTSATGAAIEDMKKVAMNRWPLVKFALIPTLVQGEGAANDISSSIEFANTLDCDLIIVGRGGGSVEDLWAFNEEIVADAIFNSKKAIISAVGHEVDYLISDFVADIRAATPSNAIEIALPDINEHRMYLDSLSADFDSKIKNHIHNKQINIDNLKKMFDQNSINSKFNFIESEIKLLESSFKSNLIQRIRNANNEIEILKNRYESNWNSVFSRLQNDVNLLVNSLESKNPSFKSKNGFVELSKDNKIISLANAKIGDEVSLQTDKYIATCTINNLKKQ